MSNLTKYIFIQKKEASKCTTIRSIKGLRIFSFILLFINFFSCKKLIDVDPPINKIIGAEVYNNDKTAPLVLSGIYENMSRGSFATGRGSLSVSLALSADELNVLPGSGTDLELLYKNDLKSQPAYTIGYWNELYEYVFRINSVLEGVSNSTRLSENVKVQLLGEAKFLRAFIYFYLVNIYGEVPLIMTTDYKITSVAPKDNIDIVYQQIVKDLQDSQSMLNDLYVGSNATTVVEERTRPNRSTATSLLARVYLYRHEWKLAEEESTKIISNTTLYENQSLSAVFLKNSKEAIWQLQPVYTSIENTEDGFIFILDPGPSTENKSFYLSEYLLSAFEANDNRKANWVGKYTDFNTSPSTDLYYPFKYKIGSPGYPVTEYLMVFRLAEQYLIRAESRVMQNNFSDALSDINAIRQRAGLIQLTEIDENYLLSAIEHERQVELFCEWGHRWFDLKRTGRIGQVMTTVDPSKGGTWSNYKILFPIPQKEIESNPSLTGQQNEGYN